MFSFVFFSFHFSLVCVTFLGRQSESGMVHYCVVRYMRTVCAFVWNRHQFVCGRKRRRKNLKNKSRRWKWRRRRSRPRQKYYLFLFRSFFFWGDFIMQSLAMTNTMALPVFRRKSYQNCNRLLSSVGWSGRLNGIGQEKCLWWDWIHWWRALVLQNMRMQCAFFNQWI